MHQDIKKLIEGNKKFKQKFFASDSTLFNELVLYGQKPKIMIVSCSDSRVDPAMIFNCQPGELFVIRNVANLVPPCEESDTYHGTSAALEFGTWFLEVEHIIILGHTQCGGIRALLESSESVLDKQSHGFIAKWMDLARPAYNRIVAEHSHACLEEKVTLCEQYALINSLKNLHSFSWIKQREDDKKLTLHAWYFDLKTGEIHAYNRLNDTWQVF